MSDRPRYQPDQPFPAYAFIPGQNPHPITHPDGHSHGRDDPPPAPLEVAAWRQSAAYLRGVDLYNHGYPWEAHEAWEGLWRQAERGSIVHVHLQGLIQCAAAVVKAHSKPPIGVTSLTDSAMTYLERVIEGAGSPFLGVDLVAFTERFRGYARAQPSRPEKWPVIRLQGL